MNSFAEEGDPGSVLLRLLWRARWMILAAALVGAVLGYLSSLLQATSYTAQSRLILGASAQFSPIGYSSGNTGGDATRYVSKQTSIIASIPVLTQAIALAKKSPGSPTGDELDAFAKSIDVTSVADSDVITIAATASSSAQAKATANAVGKAYMKFVRQQVASKTLQALRTTTDAGLRTQMQTQATVYGSGVEVFEPAALPREPSAPRPKRNALFLAFLAALLAMGVALVRQNRAVSIVTWQDAALSLGVPMLGEVPAQHQFGSCGRGAPESELDVTAYQMVLVGLGYSNPDTTGALLVTSAGADSSTETGVAYELAVAAARVGNRVLVVGPTSEVNAVTTPASPRGGSHQLAATRWLRPSLSSIQLVQGRLVRTEFNADTDAAPLNGALLRLEVERLRPEADLIVVDAPTLNRNPLAYAMAGAVDTVLLVANDKTRAQDIVSAVQRVSEAGSTLAIVNAGGTRRRLLSRRQSGHS